MTSTRITVPVPARSEHDEVTRIAGGYLDELAAQAAHTDVAELAAVVMLVLDTLRAGRTVYLAGNGGSASTAAHIACDWLNACARARIGKAHIVNLADGVATLTALANDDAYDQVFARQLELRGAPGDLLVLISVSGNSPNLLEAARRARAGGMKVAGLLGNSDGPAALYCDASTVLGGGDYGLAEDLHLAVNHIVVRALGGGVPLRYREAG